MTRIKLALVAALLTAQLSIIYCSDVAAAMTISGTPPTTVEVGLQYYFMPVVKNANTKKLEFNYINKPAWSNGYQSSGLIMGTPTKPGVYANIQIGAWDGEHYAVLPPFTITVRGAGTPPPAAATLQISGAPATTAMVGQFYGFRPTVVASPGSSLIYKVTNKPSWAQFSAATGTLTGTPAAGNVARDPNIVISVSNGAKSAALSAFNIVVEPAAAPAAGTAILSWSKPSQNTNGSPLTDLAGFIVRYGKSAAALTSQFSVGSPNATNVEIGNLAPGNWFFEVAAVNAANVVGQFSALVGEAIQ